MTTQHLRNSISRSPLRRGLLLMAVALACFGLSPAAQAVLPSPTPDGGYPGNNTAEGQNALQSLTTGLNNAGIGFRALFKDTSGGNNTATGAQTLYSNTTGTQNTASGYVALTSNTTGVSNTAIGAGALHGNTTASHNTATGYISLYNNSTGSLNVANGDRALYTNTTGSQNVATGYQALGLNTTGTNNVAIGDHAMVNNVSSELNTVVGHGADANIVTTGSGGNIYIGAGAGGSSDEVGFIRIGTSTIKGFPYDTYIAGINGRGVDSGTAADVYADANQKIGTVLIDANGNSVFFKPQAVLDESLKQQKRIAELEATVERQQKGMELLTAQLKEQAGQIQKVSAQLGLRKSAPQTVVNNR